MKQCTKCKLIKADTEFFKNKKNTGTGLASHCKTCNAILVKEWSVRNREKSRFYSLKYGTGVTRDQYEELFHKQNGLCAICFKTASSTNHKKLAVDHDHKTGVIRGLLCYKCNMGLGYLQDNIEILDKAIHYLETAKTSLKFKNDNTK